MGCGLGSGDPWTLVANCIMANSVLVSRFKLPMGLKMIQVGDDITCNMMPIPRKVPLAGSDKVITKELTTRFKGNPSFTSFSAISPEFAVPHRTRFIVKCGFVKRNKQQHDAWRTEFINLRLACAQLGLSTTAHCIAAINKTDPFVVESLLMKAYHVMQLEYSDIPEDLMSEDPGATIQVFSRDYGCFGFALAHAVPKNVTALNVLNTYSTPMSTEDCVDACIKYKVRYKVIDSYWNLRSAQKIREEYAHLNVFEPIVYLFRDHAVCCRRYQSSSYARLDRLRFVTYDTINDDW
jgi:hypothetical protein